MFAARDHATHFRHREGLIMFTKQNDVTAGDF